MANEIHNESFAMDQSRAVTSQPGHAAPPPPPGPQPPGPAQYNWMDKPSVQGCPPGLEYLAMIDQLLIKQQVELLELVTGWESQNRYRVFNSVGQQVYFAQEESNMCMRQCCGPGRGFVMHITDNNQQEVLRLTRRFKCCAGCCWCANSDCCAFELEVEAPLGTVIGYVRQEQSGWKPKFSIMTPDREDVGHIVGPCCVCNCPCCGDVEFPVLSPDMSQTIGKVAKQWTGAAMEIFTDADTFGVTFPMDMDVNMKATMLGAVFLIDFMYFEESSNNNH